jgi:hypothetical protein
MWMKPAASGGRRLNHNRGNLEIWLSHNFWNDKMTYVNSTKSNVRVFLWNGSMYLIGLVFLILAYLKNKFSGYRTPTVIGNDDLYALAKHVIRIFSTWKISLQDYMSDPAPFSNKKVLELGPGNSLGTGMLIALDKCEYYDAFDMFPLARSTAAQFYKNVLPTIHGVSDVSELSDLVWNATQGTSIARFNYVIDPEFELVKMAGDKKFNIIVSCAAFEHFRFVEQTIRQLSKIAEVGCVLCTEIDFRTHSRWIRDHDPNNIYRYSNYIYNIFYFNGQPNRVRPVEYFNYLKKYGWKNIRFIPIQLNKEKYLRNCEGFMYKNFRSSQQQQMDVLTGCILAVYEGKLR